MNTNEIPQEQISALADGELSNAYVDVALAALRQNEGRATWDAYHQIGDILRSDDMAFSLSSDFTSRMLERLNAEPAMIAAPLAVVPIAERHIAIGSGSAAIGTRSLKRFALPSMAAAAAVAAVAFITVPHMMNVNNQSTSPAMLSAVQMTLASASNINVGYGSQTVTLPADSEVLRDSRIDEYLSAHQRFSPSLYNTAQYARSATFAIDADN
ncbi:sigma-E factor negative regulatory protein [Glaciimonas sp. CA11.2]|uniref:sigma-E factor negative regulatory protein n=1 Tax=unclassified Glaciimonas TaxID=2644401 RepID=UPI002AB38C48|nr:MULTISPECIES: sigma-E factor negative regulatory protein [unclassified Glaciimonas]MDY7544953.1 sigma-E factor negative regulatory protein [Glaciimonas sp. CA11.2]MEB0013256.1 sigma-E factor negative regulatory protein [Glaciimonas sp. Cout2]MEB0082503.1 sigma-E factor negative regulatory protein [Glaciimonas sp. Gout2]MEB0162766.1 sigma-E factor negative regulatory protein [Glaciimonas sp. CA11.2]